jgi:hypothetical protein
MSDLMEVRGALLTTSNNNLWGGTTAGGAEVNKLIDQLITDNINRDVDLRPIVDRKPMDQLAYIWNIRKDLGSTGKAAFYSEGATGTPYPSTKTQMYATALALRSDYEVSGLALSAMRSYFDALTDEAKDAIDALKLAEEKEMICGTDTNAYGLASGYLGLLQLMRWYQTNGGDTEGTAANKMGATDAVYGWTRGTTSAAVSAFTDVSYVLAGTVGTSTGVLELKHMDEAIDRSDKHGGKGHDRVFFCSVERGSEINRLLQPQQRFSGTMELEGGFKIATYKGIPIITSRYMDKNGATNTTTWDSSTDADNAMYLLDLDYIEFRVLGGVDAKHVPIMGLSTAIRSDVEGGYFKTYGVFVMKRFNTQCIICNLTAPA